MSKKSVKGLDKGRLDNTSDDKKKVSRQNQEDQDIDMRTDDNGAIGSSGEERYNSEEEGLLRLSEQYKKSNRRRQSDGLGNHYNSSNPFHNDEDEEMTTSTHRIKNKNIPNYDSENDDEHSYDRDQQMSESGLYNEGDDGEDHNGGDVDDVDDDEEESDNHGTDDDESEDDHDGYNEGAEDDNEEGARNHREALDNIFGRRSGGAFSGSRLLSENMAQMFPEAASFFNALAGPDSSNINGLVDGLSRRDDPYLVLETLNEISEKLLVTNTLSLERGFPATRLSRALVNILSDPFFEEELEIQLVACRCMYNLWEVNPDFSHTLISAGAIEAIQPKLMEISYIDLAEQCLQTLEALSRSSGRKILSKGCLNACLQYLDFFTIHAQRKALVIASNSCQNISEEFFDLINEVFPILSRVAIEYSDSSAVENASIAICGVLNGFRNSPDLLEKLVKPELVKRMCEIISASSSKKPTGNDSSTIVLNFSTANKLLSALATTVASSPAISLILIKDCDIGKFLNSALNRESGGSDVLENNSAVLTVSVEALMRSPKELLVKILNLVCSLLPVITKTTSEEGREMAGFHSTLLEAKQSVNQKRVKLYKLEENKSALDSFVTSIFPLLTNMYSTTVDFEVRRRVLVALLRITSIPNFSVIINSQNVSLITSLLTSIVIQAKGILSNDLSELEGNKQSLSKKNKSKLDPFYSAHVQVRKNVNSYILLLGSLLVIELLVENYTSIFVKEFDREGLLSSTGSLLELAKAMVAREQKNQEEALSNSTFKKNEKIGQHSHEQSAHNNNAEHHDERANEKEQKKSDYEEEHESQEEEVEAEGENGDHDGDADENPEEQYRFEDENEEHENEDDNDEEIEDDDDDIEYEDEEYMIRRYRYSGINKMLDADITGAFVFDRYDDSLIVKSLIISLSKINDNYHKTRKSDSFEKLPHIKIHEEAISRLNNTKENVQYTYEQWYQVWEKLAFSLNFEGATISSFELSSLGLIPALIKVFTGDNKIIKIGSPCYKAFVDVFVTKRRFSEDEEIPLTLLVNKLQEALGRAESFEILTSGNAPVRSSFSLMHAAASSNMANKAISMARQIKIRLSCDDEDTLLPESYKLIMLSTHAIATFKSIHSFLKGRIMVFSRLSEAIFSPNGTRRRPLASGDADEEEDLGNDRIHEDDDEADNTDEEIIEDDFEEGEDHEETALSHSRRGSEAKSEKPDIGASDNDDWYLEFFINGETVPLETTIYGAIYKSLQKNPDIPVDTSEIWNHSHSVQFRKVSGKQPQSKPRSEQGKYNLKAIDNTLDIFKDELTFSILNLLKILVTINSHAEDSGANVSLFLNWKLTAKLNRQLEEPLIVVSGTLPTWSVSITSQFPFIFPMSSRLFFLQSTSFGYSRLIQQWKLRTAEDGNNNNASADAISELGRPNRHKIRISRKHLLQSGIKLLDLYGTHPSVLEIEYFNEEGSGLGPTLEFYSSISREFCKKSLKLWRSDNDDNKENPYVHYHAGLFPSPVNHEYANSDQGSKGLKLFKMLGKLVARALLDNRLVDFAFNLLFFEVANTIENDGSIHYENLDRNVLLSKVKVIDRGLANSLTHLQKYVEKTAGAGDLSPAEKEQLEVDGATLEDLSITFTLPGYPDIKLVEGGDDILVNMSNVDEYIGKVIDMTIGKGVYRQIKAFTDGFSEVFPYNAMTIFTPMELISMFGNGEEDWSFETLASSIHANHGYTVTSTTVVDLLEIMSTFSKEERRKFLQFLTGAPKLPIGGFKALRPEFTVVRKPSEDGYTADDYLPSVMTCANYLKMPEYSSKEKMRERLIQSINEGLGAFLLS